MSSGSPSQPGLEAGRGQQVVEPHRQREALLGREERLEVHARRCAATGGLWICWISAGEVEVLALLPGRARGWSRAGCARGSASGRRRCRAGRAGWSRWWRCARGTARRRRSIAGAGAANDLQDRDRHARRCCRACRWRSRPPRAAAGCGRRPGPTRPGPSSTARPAARRTPRASGPCLRASSSLIQGAKSSAARSGNVSSRLARSPLGSMTIAGMPSMAASSSSARHRPVLPLPVMPTQTAWVTRSLRVVEDQVVASACASRGRTSGRGRRRRASRSRSCGEHLFQRRGKDSHAAL